VEIVLIKEAAIQRKSDGRIWTGRRHGNVIHQIISDGHAETIKHSEFIQGFITDDGKFVDRHEAFKIAVECKQLLNPKNPWASPTLMSEDLY
jgi:hypothetical protein